MNLIEKAVYGTERLYESPDYYSPITYNSPLDVLEIAMFLEPISCETLETYNAVEVKAEDVLQSHNWFNKYDDAVMREDWVSRRVCEIYTKIRSLYLSAVEHNEGVLVSIW